MFDPPLRATQHCRYYSYEFGSKCAKGLDLSAPGASLVCMPKGSNPPKKGCPKRKEYTAVERDAWQKWAAARMGRLVEVLSLIPGDANEKKDKQQHWGSSGSFECPACKAGTVRWSRAPNNGHIHAACSTPNCASIMQ